MNTQSGMATAGASAQFRIVGLRDNINEDGTENVFGQYAKLIVRPNEHVLKTQTGV